MPALLAKQIADYNANQASLGPEPQPLAPAEVEAMQPTLAKLPVMAQPKVSGPDEGQQQINNDQAQLQKVQWHQAHPWGTPENHPGTMGKIAHVLSVAGNIAGNIFAPATMSLIPGTQLNMQDKEQGLAHRLNEEITNESANHSRDALTAKTQQEVANEPEAAADRHALTGAQVEHMGVEDQVAQQPSLAAAYAHAVNEAMKGGRDPGQDPVVQHLADAITSIQKQPAPTAVNAKEQVQRQLIAAEEKGDNAAVAKYQQQLKDMDPMGQQRLQVTIQGQQTAGDARDTKADATTRTAAYKAFQPSLDSGERFNVMAKNYEDAISTHDQQAMLSLLANHLGMTMGLQKGARLTKDIIHEAEQSRPWLQGLQAKFDKDGYLAGVNLTPEQMRQMVDLGRGRFSEDTVKARSESRYLGAKDDGPDRVPSKSTINFYLAQAHGDAARAKQLAAEDGWTVK